VLQQLIGFAVRFHRHVGAVLTEEAGHTLHGIGLIDHHTHQIRRGVIPKDAVNEILIPIEQNRRRCRFGRFLNGFPLTQE